LGVVNVTRNPDYRDIDLEFTRNRFTHDIDVLVGADAISRSIKNLVNTNFYERPFQPYIGSNVQKLLFDNANALTANFLQQAIVEVIQNFEPRVTVMGIRVTPDLDRNTYIVEIVTKVQNLLQPVNVSMILERIR
jgi:phage baseplate assembly protein W